MLQISKSAGLFKSVGITIALSGSSLPPMYPHGHAFLRGFASRFARAGSTQGQNRLVDLAWNPPSAASTVALRCFMNSRASPPVLQRIPGVLHEPPCLAYSSHSLPRLHPKESGAPFFRGSGSSGGLSDRCMGTSLQILHNKTSRGWSRTCTSACSPGRALMQRGFDSIPPSGARRAHVLSGTTRHGGWSSRLGHLPSCSRLVHERGMSTFAHKVAPEIMGKARWLSLPVGLGAGLFGSLVGVGGGVLVVPTIVAACKSIPQRLVSGTSLAVVVSTASVSATTYTAHGCIDFVAAGLIAPAAMLTAPLGALATARINNSGLKRILGYFLYVVAVLVPLKPVIFHMRGEQSAPALDGVLLNPDLAAERLPSAPNMEREQSATHDEAPLNPNLPAGGGASAAVLVAPASTHAALPVLIPLAARHAAAKSVHDPGLPWWERARATLREEWPGWGGAAALMATGSVAGFASGLLGIGGGTIVTPMLALTTDLSQTTVVGTSLLALLPPSCTGLLQHWRLGNVDCRMAAGLAAGTAFGSLAGSNLAVHAPPGVLEAIFSVGMLILGRRTLQGIPKPPK